MSAVKFKRGDLVRCLPGANADGSGRKYGGSGYIEGREFIVGKMNSNVLWPEGEGYGVYTKWVELVERQRVEKGDMVECVYGGTVENAGLGYIGGRQFVVGRIERGGKDILFPDEGGHGVYAT